MKQLPTSEINFMQSLLDSLQYEVIKAKDNGGFVSPSYVNEKAIELLKVVNKQVKVTVKE